MSGLIVTNSSFVFEGETLSILENRPRTQETDALLVCFHGAGVSPRTFSAMIESEKLCRREGVHILIPGCLDGFRWNENPNPGFIRSRDDVSFIQALIAQRVTDFTSGAVYAMGYSSGAQMIVRLEYEGSEFDAVTMVCGARLKAFDLQPGWSVDHPCPTMMVNGTADTQIGYNPGKVGMYSVPDSMKYWANLAGASGPRTKRNFPNSLSADNSTAYRENYVGAKPCALITVTGGGHTWPGTPQPQPANLGAVNRDFSATTEGYSFMVDATA